MKIQSTNLPVNYDLASIAALQHTMDSIIVVVFTLNQYGKFVFVNKPCTDVWGYLPEELVQRSVLDIVVKEDQEPTQRYLNDLMAGKAILHFENRFQRKDGSTVPISWASRWDAHNGLMYCAIRDITERRQLVELKKRFKTALQKQNQQMISMLDRITDGFFAIDPNWIITFANQRAKDILGMDSEDLTGKNLWDIFPKAKATEFERNLSKALYEQVPVRFEARSYTLPIDVEISAYPSENGITIFYRDVTHEKRLQQVLEEEREKHQQQINAATIAAQEKERAHVGRELHDNVNQVLTSVKLYQEICLSNEANREELTKRSIKLLQESINEIRSLSKRLSAPSLGNIKLSESVKELVELVADTNQLEITIDIIGIEGLEVSQDLHLAIYRILQEHLTNILKHAGAKQAHITLNYQEEGLVLLIIDDGKGFNMKQKQKGIGMVNMQTRAESVNGRIEVTSDLNKGCVLTAVFPLQKQ